mgnify:CR=1 FL=1
MKYCINDKIPNSKCPLISICIKFILIFDLIWNHLVKFTTLKFNLLFIKLVFNDISPSFVSLEFFLHFIFLIQLRDTLSIIRSIVLISICGINSFRRHTSVHRRISIFYKEFHTVSIFIDFNLICTLSKLSKALILHNSLFARVICSTFQQRARRRDIIINLRC